MNLTNKHPEIQAVTKKWERVRVLKEELEDDYGSKTFFLRLPNESADAYEQRKQAFITGFVNPSGHLLTAKGDSVYRKDPQRENLSDIQEAFVDRADKSGQRFQELLQNEVAPSLSTYGTVFAVLDKPREVHAIRASELEKGLPYLTVLSPFQVIDFEWAPDGELLWFRYCIDTPKDRTDPDKMAPLFPGWSGQQAVVTWTRETYTVKSKAGKDIQAVIPNPFKFVPVVIQAQHVEPNKTIGKSSFFASSNYLITANNLLASGNNEVYKNASSILLVNENDWRPEEQPSKPDTNEKQFLKQSGDVKNVFRYQDKGDKPEYLARDLDLIDKAEVSAQKYFERVTENERSALSVGTAKQPASGVSKAYDFQQVNDNLSSFATAAQNFEIQALRMVDKMGGGKGEEFTVSYSRDFDVRMFNEKIDFVDRLIKSGFPSMKGKAAAYKTLIPEIANSTQEKDEISKEITDWAEKKEKPNEGGEDGNRGTGNPFERQAGSSGAGEVPSREGEPVNAGA